MNREQKESFRIYGDCHLSYPTVIVGWKNEIGKVADTVVESFLELLDLDVLADLCLKDFYVFNGVAVGDDIINFPQSRFFSCPQANVLVFRGDVPDREPHQYLETILDFMVEQCRSEEIWTVGGFVSTISHLSPRRVFATVTQPEYKSVLQDLRVNTDVDYETPPQGARPSLNHFLLWVARRRGIAGYSLWVEVPFYLAGLKDPVGCKAILEVLDSRFTLGLDFDVIDSQAREVNQRIQELQSQNPDVNRSIQLLEQGLALSKEEGETLVREVARVLQQ
ncbi:MAG: PAC2 family protein [Dehalococcoidia bacterium]